MDAKRHIIGEKDEQKQVLSRRHVPLPRIILVFFKNLNLFADIEKRHHRQKLVIVSRKKKKQDVLYNKYYLGRKSGCKIM